MANPVPNPTKSVNTSQASVICATSVSCITVTFASEKDRNEWHQIHHTNEKDIIIITGFGII